MSSENKSSKKNVKNTKTILITGASSGIGKATAKHFAKKGYNVIITGRRADKLQEMQTKFSQKYGANVLSLPFDITSIDQTKAAINSLDRKWREIDILINNAGGAKGLDPIQDGDFDHWNFMIDTNIKGLLYITRLIVPQMVARGSGHILNICSTAGHEVYANGGVYCATKHAVDALTKAMRYDMYKHGIRVSQISPGMVEDTEFSLNRFDGDVQKAKIYEDVTPLNSKDIAELIYFVITRPNHVNVQDILVMSSQQASSTQVDRSGRKYG